MRARIAVIGLGNTLAGDDGVGVRVADRLAVLWSGREHVRVTSLSGDLFEVAEMLDQVDHFIFLDAIAGDRPGELKTLTNAPRALAASLHQTDIGSVMDSLQALDLVHDFPTWEVRGVVIRTPEHLGEKLSAPVSAAARRLQQQVETRVEELLGNAASRPVVSGTLA